MQEAGDLFRSEAIDAKEIAVIGRVQLALPVSHQIWTLFFLFITVMILLWLSLGSYTRREHVTGVLVPDAGLLQIRSRTSGFVSRLLVKEGTKVVADGPLAVIAGEQGSAAVGDTQKAVIAGLKVQRSRLEMDLTGAEEIASRQAVDLRAQQASLRHQISETDAQLLLAHRQVHDLSALLSRLNELGNRGFASAVDIQQQRTQELDAESQVRSLSKQRLQLVQQLNSLTGQLAQLPMTSAAKRNEIERQLSQASQSIAQAELERSTVLQSIQAGTVSSIVVSPGQSIAPQQLILSIMPTGAQLQAQLWVPSRAIGFIKEGSKVALHYQPFPFQKFGVTYGTVNSISTSAIATNEVAFISGSQSPQDPLYRLEVSLPSQVVDAYGHSHPLKPGMQVEADLLLDRRRMFEWMLEPIYAMAQRFKAAD